MISHDHTFIDTIATRIVELNRNHLRNYPRRLAEFESTKAHELKTKTLTATRTNKLLTQKKIWIRKDIETRHTHSVNRVTRLKQLRTQRATQHETLNHVQLKLDTNIPPNHNSTRINDLSNNTKKRVTLTQTLIIVTGKQIGRAHV